MEQIYIKETNAKNKWDTFLLHTCFAKNIFYKYIVEEKGMFFFLLPMIKGKKYGKKVCKFLTEQGVTTVYFSSLQEKQIEQDIKKAFHYQNGENTFLYFFPQILDFLFRKKNIKMQEASVYFISNDAKKTESYIKPIYKKVKKIGIYTNNPALFEELLWKTREEYGFMLEIKGGKDHIKKYNSVYINLSKDRIVKEDLFIGCTCFDMYKKYKGAYQNVNFFYKIQLEKVIKQQKIDKNLQFMEYHIENDKKFSKNQCKIVNIEKF